MKNTRLLSALLIATLLVTQINTTVAYAGVVESGFSDEENFIDFADSENAGNDELDDLDGSQTDSSEIVVEEPENESKEDEQDAMEDIVELPEADLDEAGNKIRISYDFPTGNLYDKNNKKVNAAYSTEVSLKNGKYTVTEEDLSFKVLCPGYEFLGWYMKVSGQKTDVKIGTTLTADTILYSSLKEICYDVELEPNFPDSKSKYRDEVENYYYDTSFPETSSEAYVFLGWYTETGKKVEKVADTVQDPYKESGKIKVVGKWSKKATLYYDGASLFKIFDEEGNTIETESAIPAGDFKFGVEYLGAVEGNPIVKVNGTTCRKQGEFYIAKIAEGTEAVTLTVTGVRAYYNIANKTHKSMDKYYALKEAQYDGKKDGIAAYSLGSKKFEKVYKDTEKTFFAVALTNQAEASSQVTCLVDDFKIEPVAHDEKKNIFYFETSAKSLCENSSILVNGLVDINKRHVIVRKTGDFNSKYKFGANVYSGYTKLESGEISDAEKKEGIIGIYDSADALNIQFEYIFAQHNVKSVKLNGKELKATDDCYNVPVSKTDQEIEIELAKKVYAEFGNEVEILEDGSSVFKNVDVYRYLEVYLYGGEMHASNFRFTDTTTKNPIEYSQIKGQSSGEYYGFMPGTFKDYAGHTVLVEYFENVSDEKPLFFFRMELTCNEIKSISVAGAKTTGEAGVVSISQIPGAEVMYKLSFGTKDIYTSKIRIENSSKEIAEGSLVLSSIDKNCYLNVKSKTTFSDETADITIYYDLNGDKKCNDDEKKLTVRYIPDRLTLKNTKPSVKVKSSSYASMDLELTANAKALEKVASEDGANNLYYYVKADATKPVSQTGIMKSSVYEYVKYQPGVTSCKLILSDEDDLTKSEIVEYSITAILVQCNDKKISEASTIDESKPSSVLKAKTVEPAFAKKLSVKILEPTIYTTMDYDTPIATVSYDSKCTTKQFRISEDGGLNLSVDGDKIILDNPPKVVGLKNTVKITITSEAPDSMTVTQSFKVKLVDDKLSASQFALQVPNRIYKPYGKAATVTAQIVPAEGQSNPKALMKRVKRVEYCLRTNIDGVSINKKTGKITIDKSYRVKEGAVTKLEVYARVFSEGEAVVYPTYATVAIHKDAIDLDSIRVEDLDTSKPVNIRKLCDKRLCLYDSYGKEISASYNDFNFKCNKSGISIDENGYIVFTDVASVGDIVFTATTKDGSGKKASLKIKTTVNYDAIPVISSSQFYDDDGTGYGNSVEMTKSGSQVYSNCSSGDQITITIMDDGKKAGSVIPKAAVNVKGAKVLQSFSTISERNLILAPTQNKTFVQLGAYKVTIVNNNICDDATVKLKKSTFTLYYNPRDTYSVDSCSYTQSADPMINGAIVINHNKYNLDTNTADQTTLTKLNTVLSNVRVSSIKNGVLQLRIHNVSSLSQCEGKYYLLFVPMGRRGAIGKAVPITVVISDVEKCKASTKLKNKYTFSSSNPVEIVAQNTVKGEEVVFDNVEDVLDNRCHNSGFREAINYSIDDGKLTLTPRYSSDGQRHTYKGIVKFHIVKNGITLQTQYQTVTVEDRR